MPLYEYRCLDCEKSFEKMIRFSEDPNVPQECPECHGNHTRKQITSFATRLAASGLLSGSGSSASSGSCGSRGGFS